MKKTLLSLLFLIFINASTHAENSALWNLANATYIRGSYDSSIVLYDSLLVGGMSNDVYYNLGNAHFKLKNYPRAILNYEKALKVNPNDADAAFNLSLANLFVVDKIVPVPPLFYENWRNQVVNSMSLVGWQSTSLIFSFLSLILFILLTISRNAGVRKALFFSGIFTVLLTLLSYSCVKTQVEKLKSENNGIIFDSSTYVKSSPDEKGIDLFILHEGVKVTILDQVGEWKKIWIANGNEGWIHTESLEII